MMCLTLLVMIGVVLLFTDTRSASGCTDWDEDGVCAEWDCNDFNPSVLYDGDNDGDGFTVCSGDCDDDDPSIHHCGEIYRMYPVYYQPPEQPCREGFTVTTKLYNCWYDECGVKYCDTEPYYQYDTDYLRDCYH
jgi:hypothetical protein